MSRKVIPQLRKRHFHRRGHATLWVIIATPAMLAMLVLVSDVANLWLARVEVENAAESAALAAANLWGDGTDDAVTRSAAHQRAQELAQANLVLGQAISVNDNDNPGNTNNNAATPGEIMLGTYNTALATFDASAVPATPSERACYASVSATITSLWVGFAGPFSVHATAVARYDAGTGTAVLVRLDPNDDPSTAP